MGGMVPVGPVRDRVRVRVRVRLRYVQPFFYIQQRIHAVTDEKHELFTHFTRLQKVTRLFSSTFPKIKELLFGSWFAY